MFSDHCMGPAGGSGHPWGLLYRSHTVIYGLLFNGHMKTALTMATSGQSVREPALALRHARRAIGFPGPISASIVGKDGRGRTVDATTGSS